MVGTVNVVPSTPEGTPVGVRFAAFSAAKEEFHIILVPPLV